MEKTFSGHHFIAYRAMNHLQYIPLCIVFYLSCSNCATHCPDDVVTEVFSCLANVTGFGGPAPIAGGDVHILQDNCQNGGFSVVVNCLENLYANCYDQKRDLDVLKKLVHIPSIRSSFSHICSYIDVYANSSHCMRLQDHPIKVCVDMEYARFTRGLKQVMSPQEIIEQYCKYIIGMSECIENPIRKACTEKVADLLARFMAGLTPPMCTSASSRLNGLYDGLLQVWLIIIFISWL